jgi:hypothetical protein
MNEELGISNLLDAELEKLGFYKPQSGKHDFHSEMMKLVYDVSKEVFSRISGTVSGYHDFNSLLGLIKTLRIELFWAEEIFHSIENMLVVSRTHFLPEQEGFRRCNNHIFELKITAVDFHKRLIYQELENDDLPEKLKIVKKELSKIFYD